MLLLLLLLGNAFKYILLLLSQRESSHTFQLLDICIHKFHSRAVKEGALHFRLGRDNAQLSDYCDETTCKNFNAGAPHYNLSYSYETKFKAGY